MRWATGGFSNLICLQLALKESEYIGLSFALLREPNDWNDSGDIDVVVKDSSDLGAVLSKQGYIKFSGRIGNCKYLKYFVKSDQWIHLDVHAKDVVFPNELIDSLLKSKNIGLDGISRLDSTDQAILMIFHVAINKGFISQEYRSRFINADIDAMKSRSSLYSFLPNSLNYYLLLLQQLCNSDATNQKFISEIRPSFINNNIVQPSFFNTNFSPFEIF